MVFQENPGEALSTTGLLAAGKNPLPYPDQGSRIFAATSPQSKQAIVELLARHGLEERFKVNTRHPAIDHVGWHHHQFLAARSVQEAGQCQRQHPKEILQSHEELRQM